MPTAISDKVRYINKTLGMTQEEVGLILDSSPRTVSRWSTGETSPHRVTKQRLLELAFVAEQIVKIVPTLYASTWLLSPNPLLRGESPADRIRRGDFRSVVDLLDALADGIVV